MSVHFLGLVDESFDDFTEETIQSIQKLEDEHSRSRSSQESTSSPKNEAFTQFVAQNFTQITKLEPYFTPTQPSPPKTSPLTISKLSLTYWDLPDFFHGKPHVLINME
jgi:hypothetical protein